MSEFDFLDLFCGAGGLSRGFVDAGFTCTLAIDHDEAAVETHRLNFDSPVKRVDVTTMSDFPRVSVVVGGPPCQGFSSAGLRAIGDHRNTLVGWFAETVARIRPAAFVFENVEGFLTTEDGFHVFELLDPLVEAGYYIHVRKVNVANYGLPQHRKRVLAVGGFGWAPTLPELTHSAFGAPGAHLAARHLPRTPTLVEVLAGLPEPTTEPPGVPDDHYARRLTGIELERAIRLAPGQTMRDLPAELQHESYRRRAFRRVIDGTPTDRRGGAPAGLRRLLPDEPCKAITGGAQSEFLHPHDHRYLTLRECARIQTFSDEFRFAGSPSERQQLIGNAVPPRLARMFATTLKAELGQARPKVTEGGRLLTFVPTLSSGMSPALESITERVQRRYALVRSSNVEQMTLWP